MSRWLIAIAVVLAGRAAHAETPAETPATAVAVAAAPAPDAPPDLGDQGIGAELGAATGGHITPGGLRIAGHYLYQLSSQDWFDGIAAFTFGGGTAACFRDRMDAYICDHGVAQGDEIEIAATVRHFFGQNRDRFWPFLRGGVGIGIVRYANDGVTGLAIPVHAGAGIRASITPTLALTIEGDLAIGFGEFNHTLGIEPQVGLGLTAGVEFKL
jgi:hypothetical protein